jgi:uncharacterized protein (TIGR00251 family)
MADLRVRVQPRASRNEVTAWRDGVLHVRLTAPPVEGAANAACRDFLADLLGVKRAQVELVGGERSREKRFRVSGLTDEEIEATIKGRLA